MRLEGHGVVRDGIEFGEWGGVTRGHGSAGHLHVEVNLVLRGGGWIARERKYTSTTHSKTAPLPRPNFQTNTPLKPGAGPVCCGASGGERVLPDGSRWGLRPVGGG